MERDRIIAIAAAVLGAAALIFAFVTKSQVNSVSKSLTFDTTINVPVAAPEAEPERVLDMSTGEQIISTENLTNANMNIILRDGVLRVYDSTLRVPKKNGKSTEEDLYVFLSGEHTVRYDSTSDYLVVDGSIILHTIDAADATYNGICQFMGSNGEGILIGERRVNTYSALAVVYTLANSEVTDTDVAVVQTILNGATANTRITGLSLFGTQVNADWAENIIMTSKAVELIKGGKKVYISPYSGTFADGATNTLVAGETTFSYSDNIKDTATGYSPYIFTFNADQNGTVQASGSVSGQLKVKVLSQDNMTIKDLFQ